MKDLEQYTKNSFTDSELEGMAHGNDPVAYAYRELLAFRRAAGQPKCVKCDGSGLMDSGGTQPWGESISIECDCTTPQAAHTEQVIPITPTREASILHLHDQGDWMSHVTNESCDKASAAPKPE